MTTKSLLTVGFELADAASKYESFRSKASLLDWDIVLFKPDISEFVGVSHETYQGKPCLGDSASFRAKECCEHWRREIKQAAETGKTVIVFLPGPYEVFVDTGQRTYSGTGRNQKTTRHVEPLSNYSAIPAKLGPVAASGKSMKLAAKGAEVLAPYWAEFEESSSYEVVLEGAAIPAVVLTRAGDKPVGAMYRSKASSGTLLLLPDVDFYPDSFLVAKEGGHSWTPKAQRFARTFVASIVALDKALHATSEVTPQPEWAAAARYSLGPEAHLRAELLDAERAVEAAQKRKEELREELANAGSLRGLLFEKGKPLENAIISALRILGFNAEPFKESDSEFDVVFFTAEGRLIGEAEGRDSKAIGIEKLRQLSMNIHEDLQQEAVLSPAKAVLFGNPFRLQPPDDGGEPFTEKCKSAAQSNSTALVHTPDLFAVAQYLVDNSDVPFAEKIRQVLLSTVGRVEFPPLPMRDEPSQEDTVADSRDA